MGQKIVVFDIDETLCFTYPNSEYMGAISRGKRIRYTLEDRSFLWHQFCDCRQLIEDINDLGARIAFFSAGSEERNVTVLEALMDRLDMQKFPYEVFSGQHMKRRGLSDYGKKDLSVVSKDLDDVILVDDSEWVWIEGQGTFVQSIPLYADTIRKLPLQKRGVYLNYAMSHLHAQIIPLLLKSGEAA